MAHGPLVARRDIRRAPPWRVGLVLGAVGAGLLALSPSPFLDGATPTVSHALYEIARSAVQGALVGGIYGITLSWLGLGRFRSHLGAGLAGVLTWLVARLLLEGRLGVLFTPVGAGIVLIGGPLLGSGIWLCLWIERAGDAA